MRADAGTTLCSVPLLCAHEYNIKWSAHALLRVAKHASRVNSLHISATNALMLIMEHVDNVRAQLEFYLLVLHFQKKTVSPSPPPQPLLV